MRWTSREVRYLEEHAHEGCDAIARKLERSPESVRQQAKHYGVSLRTKWWCPHCARWSYKPLSVKTGWCSTCTKAARRQELEDSLHDMREEVMREKQEDRKRQAVYSAKNRLKD